MSDRQYREITASVLDGGERILTRNSWCRRLFGLSATLIAFPLVWARKVAWKKCLRELEWFMSGSWNINTLHPSARDWWQPWANEDGDVSYNYSAQLRYSCGYEVNSFDQVKYLIEGIRDHPNSRRNVITTWNTGEMAQPDCPITNCWGTVIQAFVNPDNKLHMAYYQRSADVVCGLPHNWVQCWAMMLYFASRGGRQPGSVIWMGGDVHVYEAHDDLARRIVAAPPTDGVVDLVYSPTSEEFLADDFALSGDYLPLLTDRAEMIV